MANTTTETTIKVSVETKEAQKEVEKLSQSVEDLKKAYQESADGSKEQKDALDKLTSAQKSLKTAQDKLNTSLDENKKSAKESKEANKGLMDIIKGLSIVGIISSAFDVFKEALMKNQKVADAVGAVMKTIENVMSALVDVISNVIDRVSKSSNGFEALGKVMSGLLTLAINPIKLAFSGISLFINECQLAWEKSFFGDGDTKTIDALNKKIAETKEGMVATAKETFEAGKDVVTNFGEAVTSVADVVTGTIEGASKINVKSIYESSKATIQLKNDAELASAQLQGVVEEYDRQAEKLRQLRDDDSNSIEDRIKANEQLGNVLKNQSQAMLSLANQKIASAKAELSANSSSIELQKALIEAENERKGILAQITGLESEQKANATALNKELIAMNKSRIDSEVELTNARKTANAELITDELAKNQQLQAIRDEQRVVELARLQENIDATKEGTQARVDAEIAYNQKKQELDIADAQAKADRDKIIKQREIDDMNARNQNTMSEFDLKKQMIDLELTAEYDKSQALIEIARKQSEEQINQLNAQRDIEIANAEKQGLDTTAIKEKYKVKALSINTALAKSEKDLAKAKIKAHEDAGEAIANTLSQLSQLMGEQTGVGKALAVVSTTISAIVGAQKAFESAQSLPFGLGAVIGPLNAGIALATGFMNVKKILAVQVPNEGGGGGGGAMPSTPTMPTPPLEPQTSSTLINQDQVNQLSTANASTRAYVVESDVTGNQERIQRLNRASRIN